MMASAHLVRVEKTKKKKEEHGGVAYPSRIQQPHGLGLATLIDATWERKT